VSFSLPLAAVLVLQQVSVLPLPREPSPDLQHIIADESALKSVEVWYSVAERLVILRSSGALFVQSTKQNVPLVPTCKGKVALADVRRLLVTMLDSQFFDLSRKQYFMADSDLQDGRELQVHSISVHTAEGVLERGFAAGKIGGKQQEVPQKFATIEKAILELKTQAVPEGKPCTLAPPLWSSSTPTPSTHP
jgi:hypothetical protein